MTFANRLDTLMSITNTSNSALSMQVSLDASLISRFRSGKRMPSKKENYLEKIAAYFSRHIVSDYQKAAFCEIAGIPIKSFPQSESELSEMIHKWLLNESNNTSIAVNSFIDSLASFRFANIPPMAEICSATDLVKFDGNHAVLYGSHGKQTLVLYFLSLVVANKSPQTLLLFSDEDFSWIADDPEYAAKWAALMTQVILRGNRIVIVHTVNRSINEMFGAIKQWLPLYMSGAIEPYYFPKTRDGVYKRTLFIAPETAAIASNAIGVNSENNANFLYTDKPTITSLTDEYNNYLKMCRPLVRIFTKSNKSNYYKTLSEFESESANCIIKSDYLTSITMPYELVKSMAERFGNNSINTILEYQKIRAEAFERNLTSCSFTEIVTMLDIEAVKNGKMKAGNFDIYSDDEVFYTPDEYILHIHNIISLLKNHDNYRICFSAGKTPAGYMLYSKESVGALVAKTSSPAVIFAINESNLTTAFWDYINTMTGGFEHFNRTETIEKLESIVKQIELS